MQIECHQVYLNGRGAAENHGKDVMLNAQCSMFNVIIMTLNVYKQYFGAQCTYLGVERHGAEVMLISDSDHGTIKYEVAVSFFPHNYPSDFAVSYDAYVSRVIYQAPGRRSKKREAAFLAQLRPIAEELAQSIGATIQWELPLSDAERH